MKLTDLFENESINLAKTYIDYFKDGGVYGADFDIGDGQIRIYQETDEEDEDGEQEEPSKYYIIKDDVPKAVWDELVQLIKEHE